MQGSLLRTSMHLWRPLELLAARCAGLGLAAGMAKEVASGRWGGVEMGPMGGGYSTCLWACARQTQRMEHGMGLHASP